MTSEKKIQVITIEEISEKAKRNYAKVLARTLMDEFGKETCQQLLDILKTQNILSE